MSMQNPTEIPRAGKQILPGCETHGQSGTRLYKTWGNMRSRCSNPKVYGYNCYGGRGICVCREWIASFDAFYAWATANGYRDGLSIDRIDANGNYEPGNCRWIPKSDQPRTMRKCVHLTAFGETKTIREWSRDPRCNVTYAALRGRLASGWLDQDVVGKPRSESHVNNPTGHGGFTAKK